MARKVFVTDIAALATPAAVANALEANGPAKDVLSAAIGEALSEETGLPATVAALADPIVTAKLSDAGLVRQADPGVKRGVSVEGAPAVTPVDGFRNRRGQTPAFLGSDNSFHTPGGHTVGAVRTRAASIEGAMRGSIGRNRRLGELTEGPDGNILPSTLDRWEERRGWSGRGVDTPGYVSDPRGFDESAGTYRLSPRSLDAFHNKLCRAREGLVVPSLTFIGTSRMESAVVHGGNWATSPAGLVRAGLDTWTGRQSGTGWVGLFNTKFTNSDSGRSTWGAAVTNLGSLGPFGLAGWGIPAHADGHITFKPTQTATTGFWLVLTIPATEGGLATVKIDGTSIGTISLKTDGTGGASLAREAGYPSGMAVYHFAGLTPGVHQLRVDGVTSGTAVPVMWKADTGQGVDVNNMARGGSWIQAWVSDDPANQFGMRYSMDLPKPDLVVMGDFTNNHRSDGFGTAPFVKSQFRILIERALGVGSQVLLMPLAAPNYALAPHNFANARALWEANVGVLYDLNIEYDLGGVLDLTWAWPGSSGNTNPSAWWADDVHHETQAMIRRIADTLLPHFTKG